MFFRRVDPFLTYCLISSVWIISMIGYFSSSADNAVVLEVFKTIMGYFKSLTRMIVSSGLWRHQQLILLLRTGSSCTPAQPSVPSETIILSKTSNPVVQDRNSGYTQMVDTKTMTISQLLKCYLLKFFK